MGKKILVIEDSPTILEMTKQVLVDAGYEVVSAIDGLEGLNTARKEAPDLIISDFMLPKMDGHKVCGMLKMNEKFKNTPIIMFTACLDDSVKKISEQVGINGFILKPYEPQELLDKVKELLKT